MSDKSGNAPDQRFSSRLGLILSALGIAVGTGNIWRFPRIAAQNGGENGAGAFLFAWLIFLFLWSIPLIIAEYALGRKFRMGTIGVFKKAIGDKFAWMGTFVAFVSTAIAFFYTVVVGWCMFYFYTTLFHPLPENSTEAMNVWDQFQSSSWPLLFHFLAVAFGALVVWKGVRSIERVNKFLIPTLLFIVILSVIRAVTLPGAFEGIKYLFSPDWGQLSQPRVWLAALTQNAWDTGAGWGLFLTYAVYMQSKFGVVKNAFITGIGNNAVSIIAAIMIFGTVFSVLHSEMGMTNSETLEIMKTSGPASTGLTFIWMPQLFAKMPMGSALAVLFFLGLTFAGFSSIIAMFELPTRVLLDMGMSRSKAISLVVAVVYLFGIPSARNLNLLSNQDYVWGIALMISGAFIAIAIMKLGVKQMTEELGTIKNDWRLGRWWIYEMKYIVPVAAFILLFWWLYQSVTVFAPEAWYNPFNPFSLMTCVAQWLIVLALFIAFNGWISRKIKG